VRIVKLGVLAGLMGVGLLMLSSGLVAGSSLGFPASGGGAVVPVANTAASATTFNFNSPHPTWNTGNLCVPVQSGNNVTCTYSGSGGHHHGWDPAGTAGIRGCGCQASPLTYNFSSGYVGYNYTVNLSNLNNQNVYLNFGHSTNTITIIVSGCQGGMLNVSILSEATVNLEISASNVKVSLYMYSNSLHYNSWISGNHNSVWTYFVAAKPKLDECPSANNSKTDSYALNVTGWGNAQAIVFVSDNGPTSSFSHVYTGGWNSVWFENTTQFTCSWTWAPPSTCHHGWGPVEVQAASRSEE
jgi:hypothetical protein